MRQYTLVIVDSTHLYQRLPSLCCTQLVDGHSGYKHELDCRQYPTDHLTGWREDIVSVLRRFETHQAEQQDELKPKVKTALTFGLFVNACNIPVFTITSCYIT